MESFVAKFPVALEHSHPEHIFTMSPANRRSKAFIPGILGSSGDNFDVSELKKSILKEVHYEVSLAGHGVAVNLADIRLFDRLQAVENRPITHKRHSRCARNGSITRDK